jgi:hypothetical protein
MLLHFDFFKVVTQTVQLGVGWELGVELGIEWEAEWVADLEREAWRLTLGTEW